MPRELKGLKTFNNPGRIELEGENVNFCFFVPENVTDNDDTPTTFAKAWHHKNPKKRENGDRQSDWSFAR